MIVATERAQRMVGQVPDYYHYAAAFAAIIQANADELDLVSTNNADLKKQLLATTATWGIKYHEAAVGLPIDEASDYDTRRKKVLARIRSGAPFSADMLKNVVEAYTENPVKVQIRLAEYQVVIILSEEFGLSNELWAAVENVIHAHLGYEFNAEWIYESKVTYAWEYSTLMYELQTFAATDLYTGTLYDGPTVVPDDQNVVYASDLTAADTYEATIQDKYGETGTLYAGGEPMEPIVWPADQYVTYSGEEVVSSSYVVTVKEYNAASEETYAGTGVC